MSDQDELKLLREQVAELVKAVHALVKLQSVLNQAVQNLAKVGGPDCAVL